MNAFFNQNLPYFLVALSAAALIALAGLIFIFLRLQKMWERYQLFFRDSKIKDLEGVIAAEIEKLAETEKTVEKIIEKLKSVDRMANYGIQKVGVVRFNPFQDTGGDQSFSVAMLDAHDNGMVISSLFGRDSLRVYAKPIEKGNSSYPLTEEEKEAIKKAKLNKING
ncbi:MAG: DUF4446 family protein [bacterium]|nr:DUF4446 family protein [bacterium]